MGETRELTPNELWPQLAAWTRAHDPGSTTRRYGRHPDQHGVLRVPRSRIRLGDVSETDAARHPVAIVIHGGFWRAAYTKANTEAVAVALTEAGWATWNVEYRRVGSGGGYPATLDDVAAACRAVAELDAPLDARAAICVGHSAGGHLALWAAAEGLVAGAVALAGVCDLAAAAGADLGGGAVAELMGTAPAGGREYDHADPARRLPLGVPTLLVHGSEDDRVPIGLARAFASAARAAGDDCRLLELAGAGHFDPIDPRSPGWGEIAAAVGSLLSSGRASA